MSKSKRDKQNPLTFEEIKDFEAIQRYYVPTLLSDFFRSRFNHNDLYDINECDDPDDSGKHRLYAKADVLDMGSRIFAFFKEVLLKKNIENFMFDNDLVLMRDRELPRDKIATEFDVAFARNPDCLNGFFYSTTGRYDYRLKLSPELRYISQERWVTDPVYVKTKIEVDKLCDEKNLKMINREGNWKVREGCEENIPKELEIIKKHEQEREAFYKEQAKKESVREKGKKKKEGNKDKGADVNA